MVSRLSIVSHYKHSFVPIQYANQIGTIKSYVPIGEVHFQIE